MVVDDFDNFINNCDVEEKYVPENLVVTEILLYMRTDFVDVLAFRKRNVILLPTLSKIARSILCIPASEASAERLFSKCEQFIAMKLAGSAIRYSES